MSRHSKRAIASQGEKEAPVSKRVKPNRGPTLPASSTRESMDQEEVLGFGEEPASETTIEYLTVRHVELGGRSLLSLINVQVAKLFDTVRVIIYSCATANY
jgi:hypothetical protein